MIVTSLLTCLAAAPVYEVSPAPIRTVVGERAKLSADAPQVWAKGTKLREMQTIKPGVGTPPHHAVVAASVVVRKGDQVLVKGEDYLLDEVWGSLGVGPSGRVTPQDEVTIDYQFSLMRLDSVVRLPDGREVVREGTPHLTVPQPPALNDGEQRVANLFVDYHSDGKQPEVWPVTATAAQAVTGSTPGRIPKTMAKIAAGQPVKIVCWGDSVTTGGDASAPETRYTAVLDRRLHEQFPQADITTEVIAIGGSNSRQWLYPDKYPNQQWLDICKFERVPAAQPDLVTIEFVNDAGLRDAALVEVYEDIVARLQAIGSEVIFITPHFTMASMMGFGDDLKQPEKRPYVLQLRAFANQRGLALADAAARWEHLAAEGIPYVTLLQNGINHPDDRGHALFADELMRCFAP